MSGKMTKQFTFRLDDEQAAALAQAQGRLPMFSQAALTRAALRLGLKALLADPGQLIAPPALDGDGGSKDPQR